MRAGLFGLCQWTHGYVLLDFNQQELIGRDCVWWTLLKEIQTITSDQSLPVSADPTSDVISRTIEAFDPSKEKQSAVSVLKH